MQGSFTTTLSTLSESPEVAKASGIGEEKTLIIDMIERMIGDLDALDCDGRTAGERIIASIRSDAHRKDFGPIEVAADNGPQCDGMGWVRCGKCNGRLATYEPCESC